MTFHNKLAVHSGWLLRHTEKLTSHYFVGSVLPASCHINARVAVMTSTHQRIDMATQTNYRLSTAIGEKFRMFMYGF